MVLTASKAAKRIGRQTVVFPTRPRIVSVASVVGRMEADGPLGGLFDEAIEDNLMGQKSWEQAEVKLLERAMRLSLAKAALKPTDLDLIISGDLLNQIAASSFAGRTLDRPFFGIFGACSAWTEAMTLGAMMVDAGFAFRVGVAVSSHHETAERQFRYPIELGHQRPPTATWTVTGAGAGIIAAEGDGPRITHATPGRLVDMGVKDPFDLGSAMAPAAADTIEAHLRDTGRTPEDYDRIVTGDLGEAGKAIATDLLMEVGFNVEPVFDDCGTMMFDSRRQDVHCGGSGCACSAAVFSAALFRDLVEGRVKRLLLVSTGAMFSPTTYQQGESIPGIAYAVAIESPKPAEQGGVG